MTERAWLTTRDLAEIFGVSSGAALAGLARRLGGVKVGGRWRVPPDAIDRLRISARAKADQLDATRSTSGSSCGGIGQMDVPQILDSGWLGEVIT